MVIAQMKPTLKQFLHVQHLIETEKECPDDLKDIYEGLFDYFKNKNSKTSQAGKRQLTAQERALQKQKDELLKRAAIGQSVYKNKKPGFQNSKIDLSPEERAAIMAKPKNIAVLHQGSRTSIGSVQSTSGRTIVGNRDHLNSLYNPKAGDKIKHLGGDED